LYSAIVICGRISQALVEVVRLLLNGCTSDRKVSRVETWKASERDRRRLSWETQFQI